ncbi:MAG: hypothetical protein E6902_13500 [Paeniclostridium sordellii]|nr:hypothetical protein [Paeniclostridium sordellii]
MKSREELKEEAKKYTIEDAIYYVDNMFPENKGDSKILVLEIESKDGKKCLLKNYSNEYSLPGDLQDIILRLNGKKKESGTLSLGNGIKVDRDVLKSIKIIFDDCE